MLATAEVLVFAIQAAVKLAKTGRTIYVEETIRDEIAFPLPASLGNLSTTAEGQLQSYSRFEPGTRERLAYDRVFRPAISSREADRQERIVAAYLEYVRRGVVRPPRLVARERAGLAMLRQWDESEDPLPKPLQRVAGTLVGLAVDYLVHVPGAISADSTHGKTLRVFLEGLDAVEFDEARWDSIVIALFTAGLEALNANPDLLSDPGDEEQGNIVRTVVAGISADLAERMQRLEGPEAFDAEDRLRRFGAIVLRSALEGSSRTLLENPEMLGLEDGSQQALVTGVGSAFLDLLLGGNGVDVDLAAGLRRIASTNGLDRLMKAALKVVAEHPNLISTRRGAVDTWLSHVVTDLYELYPEKQSLFDPELLSNVAYLVLDHGARDLNELLLKNVPAGPRSLAVEAAGQVLAVLVTPPSDGRAARWDFHLSRSEITEVVSGVLGAIAGHPEWILEKPSHRRVAAATIPLALEILTKLGGGGEAAWFKQLVRSGRLEPVLAAVLSSGIIDELKDDDGASPAAEAVAASLDGVLRRVLDQGRAGAASLLEFDTLHDLLAAVSRSGILAELFGEHTAEASQAIARLVELLDAVRAGEFLSVPQMVERLAAA